MYVFYFVYYLDAIVGLWGSINTLSSAHSAKRGGERHIIIIIIYLFVTVINNEILIEHPHCIAMVTECKVLQSSHSYFVVLCNVCLRIWAEWGEIVCLATSLPLGTGCWPVWLF